MVSLTDYFSRVSTEDYITASMEQERKAIKRPVGRPTGKVPPESDGQAQASDENFQVAPVHIPADGEEPSVKSIRCQYAMKQKQLVVLYTRHGVHPTERKFGFPRKNIQQWLKSFCDS